MKEEVSEEEKRTFEYMAWEDMMGRCYNPEHPLFEAHGGRGVTVCQEWHTYSNFLRDMGRCPIESEIGNA